MKKITLLLVAAVFAIGIQSCSTEEVNDTSEDLLLENVELQSKNEESNKNQQQKQISYESKSCDNCVNVIFPIGTTQSQKNYFRNLMKEIIFETITIDYSNSCGIKETWIVSVRDGQTLNDLTSGRNHKFSGDETLVISAKKEDADDPGNPNNAKYTARWTSKVINCNHFIFN
ncbi:hypothetical protein J8L88_22620 [Aquimarina sp. MMG015]|uniref:hypothetical protein n=1 Tax=Aquimarina sp. MMG015 TaxID=2822689 RepID=UPI001B3A2714|nr:hypothetical protein [Aquimarina sp. MMG015]MBQ4805674.1 hypothetical protein [Aquimarina sp. MMG015]